MATVYRKNKTRGVSGLGWFLREASKTVVLSIHMVENPGHGWVMEAFFDNGHGEPGTRFVTDYADLSVFKQTMNRKPNLRGVPVIVEHNDGLTDSFVLGDTKRQSAKQRKKIDAALNAIARRL